MSVKRGRSGGGDVRKDACFGPNYPAERYRNPFNGSGIDSEYGGEGGKTIKGPTAVPYEGGGAGLHEGGYDKLWEGS